MAYYIMSNPPCPNCKSKDLTVVFKGNRYTFPKGVKHKTPFILYSCNACDRNHERVGDAEEAGD